MPQHAFISYVRDNCDVVEKLSNDLRAAGVEVWLDRERLRPGQRWKDAIRNAIRSGSLFIACFSREYFDRDKSYMNEELAIAISELRLRASERSWFIPVVLSGGQVPDRRIDGVDTLRDLQWVDLSDNWEPGIAAIVSAAREAASDRPDARTVVAPRRIVAKESGTGSHGDELRLHERTAFFLNWCAVMVQRHSADPAKGISLRALNLALANVLIDWHCLSESDPKRYQFLGPANLVWVPGRFGGMGSVVSSVHGRGRRIGGLFELVAELFNEQVYRQYGFKQVVRTTGGTYLIVADDIEFSIRLKSPVTALEQHYWQLLSEYYASLPDRQKAALASARTPRFANTCMVIQLAYWRTGMRRAFDAFLRGTQADTRAFASARTALSQLRMMSTFLQDRPMFAEPREPSFRNEMTGKIPCMPAWSTVDEETSAAFVAILANLNAANNLLKFAMAQGSDERIDVTDPQISLNALEATELALPEDLRREWRAVLLAKAPSRRSLGRAALKLIEWFVGSVEARIGMKLTSIESLYRQMLTTKYPLPRHQFQRGY